MADKPPAKLVTMNPLAAIMKAFKGEPVSGTPFQDMSREEAYAALKDLTKEDFGDDICKWESWLQQRKFRPVLSEQELQQVTAMLNGPPMSREERIARRRRFMSSPEAAEEAFKEWQARWQKGTETS